MNAIKQSLLTGWHFMRVIRLAVGAWLLVMAIQTHDPMAGVLSAFFLYMAFTNTGCCGPQGCAVPQNNKYSDDDGIADAKIDPLIKDKL